MFFALNTYSQSSEFFSIKPLEEHRGASFVTGARTHTKQAPKQKKQPNRDQIQDLCRDASYVQVRSAGVSVCMYVYVYIHTHMCMYVCIHIHTYTRARSSKEYMCIFFLYRLYIILLCEMIYKLLSLNPIQTEL